MKKFNLSKLNSNMQEINFTPAQEAFFVDCHLDALANPPSASMENIGAAALGGLIGGLIGLIYGIFQHFFGKKGRLEEATERFEYNFSFGGATDWRTAWDKAEKATADEKKKLIRSMANSEQFRSLVNRNAFHMDIFKTETHFCKHLIGVGETINLAISNLMPLIYEVNKNNLTLKTDTVIKIIDRIQKEILSDVKALAKIAGTDVDETDYFTILQSAKTAIQILRGSTVNMDDSEYEKQAETIVRMGERAITAYSGMRNVIDPFQKNIERKQKEILHDLDRANSSLTNGEEDQEVSTFKREIIRFAKTSSGLTGTILQYLVYDLDQRSAYVEVITKELQKNKPSKQD